jgi:hypothetical protein
MGQDDCEGTWILADGEQPTVLKKNLVMRKFVKQLDFAETNIPDDSSILLVTKHLKD